MFGSAPDGYASAFGPPPNLENPHRISLRVRATWLGAHIVFADQSDFRLIPSLLETWAARGQTPVARHRYRCDRMAKARLANGRPDTIGEPDAHLDDVPQQVRRSPSKLRFCTHCTAHPLR